MRLLPCDLSLYKGAFVPELNPVLLIDPNGLYPALRQGLTGHLKRAKSSKSGVFNGLDQEVINTTYRSSAHCQVGADIYERVKNRLDYVVDWQMSQQPGNKEYTLCEPLQFLRYDAKDHDKFLNHTDNAYFSATGEFLYTSPKRVISTVTFINDDYEGGEIVFNAVKDENDKPFVFKPISGYTLIFGSDIRYPHEVLPVTLGTRFSLVGWYGLA